MSFGGKKKARALGNKIVHPVGSHIQGCQKFLMELRGNLRIKLPRNMLRVV